MPSVFRRARHARVGARRGDPCGVRRLPSTSLHADAPSGRMGSRAFTVERGASHLSLRIPRERQCSSRTESKRSCTEVPAPASNALAAYRKDTMLGAWSSPPRCSASRAPRRRQDLGEALARDRRDSRPEALAQTGANLMAWFASGSRQASHEDSRSSLISRKT